MERERRNHKIPIAIDSKLLGEVIWVCQDENEALQIQSEKKTVAYTIKEVEMLKIAEKQRGDGYADYLRQVHAIKKKFGGTILSVEQRIEEKQKSLWEL